MAAAQLTEGVGGVGLVGFVAVIALCLGELLLDEGSQGRVHQCPDFGGVAHVQVPRAFGVGELPQAATIVDPPVGRLRSGSAAAFVR